MPRRISAALGVTHEQLESLGVFDRFLDIDSQLHVDPHLLAKSGASEMQQAHTSLNQFWTATVKVLQGVKAKDDVFWKAARRRLTIRENTHAGLGYSTGGTSGSAIGPELADGITSIAFELVQRGIVDPEIFELVGLLQEGIGADRISDMTVAIILPHLCDFTNRICAELGIATTNFEIRGKRYALPVNPKTGAYLLMMPKDILRKLPMALDWDDVDSVCMYNSELRERVNAQIGANWRRATSDNPKEKLKRVILENPAAFKDLIQQYKQKLPDPYDFANDPAGESIWAELAEAFATKFPLKINEKVTKESVVRIVREMCDHFRKLVEDNGLAAMFYAPDGKLRHERYAQLLFYGVADAYCKANNLDLTPEANSGRGPVDFKMSSGYGIRVLVEVKWSSNSKLRHGFATQVAEYEKAEQSFHAFFLVIRVTATDASIKSLEIAATALHKAGKRHPEIKVVDGRKKSSASHHDDNG